MSANIIQWNINGFYSKLEELQLIIKDHTPTIICLQKTNFNTKNNPALLHFNIFKKKTEMYAIDRAEESLFWLTTISPPKKSHYTLT